VLVLRVPTDALDRALTFISGAAGVGRELSRSATAQDVTGDLADLQSRVATQKASVARVRALLAEATSLQQVVSIESEVTKREADLEAAQARQAALAGRADLATLTVDLRTPAVVPAPSPEPNPFLGGLAGGWHAVTASTSVVLTVLGALLPVAVVVAVLGGPVLWWLRRRRRPVPPAVSAPAPDAGA
jgi:VIT1/CCC1 family predicted Fe2+/Mn2+ transporter